jgi:hypothetical protein
MPTKDFGVWTADDCALVLIDTTMWIETAHPRA